MTNNVNKKEVLRDAKIALKDILGQDLSDAKVESVLNKLENCLLRQCAQVALKWERQQGDSLPTKRTYCGRVWRNESESELVYFLPATKERQQRIGESVKVIPALPNRYVTRTKEDDATTQLLNEMVGDARIAAENGAIDLNVENPRF